MEMTTLSWWVHLSKWKICKFKRLNKMGAIDIEALMLSLSLSFQ